MERKDVFALVATAIHDLNEELEYPTLAHVTEDTPIFGGEDSIDSLSLVRLLVDVESRLMTACSLPISLADEKAMSWHNSPYRTVGTLVDFIVSKLTNESDDGSATNENETAARAVTH